MINVDPITGTDQLLAVLQIFPLATLLWPLIIVAGVVTADTILRKYAVDLVRLMVSMEDSKFTRGECSP